jgi:hypothetical protein
MKKFTIIFVLALVIVSSCKKDNTIKPEQAPTINEMKVPSSFNWKTSHDVKLKLTGFVNGLVEVSSPKGVVYQRAVLKLNVPYTMKISVPAYETSVHMQYMGQDVELKLNSDNLSYVFNVK